MNENIIEIECDKNWLLDYLEPWDYTNTQRYKNYLAIVSRDESGEFVYHWCKESRESDEYFNITEIQEGDILLAGYKDYYKPNRPAKRYYKVLEKTDEKLLLYEDTTYRKASLGCMPDDKDDA